MNKTVDFRYSSKKNAGLTFALNSLIDNACPDDEVQPLLNMTSEVSIIEFAQFFNSKR